MPTNLYGPGDNYHPTNSHVMAALIKKFLSLLRTISLKLHVGVLEDHSENFCM